jgi:hypothetical protein
LSRPAGSTTIGASLAGANRQAEQTIEGEQMAVLDTLKATPRV